MHKIRFSTDNICKFLILDHSIMLTKNVQHSSNSGTKFSIPHETFHKNGDGMPNISRRSNQPVGSPTPSYPRKELLHGRRNSLRAHCTHAREAANHPRYPRNLPLVFVFIHSPHCALSYFSFPNF